MIFRKLLCLCALSFLLSSMGLCVTAAPETQKPAQAAPALLVMVFAPDDAVATRIQEGSLTKPINVVGLPLFSTPAFEDKMRPFIGRPISNDMLQDIAKVVAEFVSTMDRVKVAISVPPQDASRGTLRLVFKVETPAEQPKPEQPGAPLVHLVFAPDDSTATQVQESSLTKTVFVRELPLFDTPEFEEKMKPFVGKPINNELIQEIAKTVSDYVRSKDRVTVAITIPPQDASKGTARLVLKVGHYRDVVVRGNRWFSTKLIQTKLGIQPGDEIQLSTLQSAIEWANSNPFRRVRTMINNQTGDPSRADLIVGVEERFPMRFIANVDNTGTDLLGRYRFSLAAMYANLWGLDHQVTYQFMTSHKSQFYQGHSLNYMAPLPWRHYIQFQGAYSWVDPKWGKIGDQDVMNQKGDNKIADLKYILPTKIKNVDLELSAGVDFKQSNNNMLFFGKSFTKAKYDIMQGVLGATAVVKDKWGSTSFTATLNLSPGKLTPRNNDYTYDMVKNGADPGEAFESKGADATYVVEDFTLFRSIELGADWQLSLRGHYQTTNSNLMGSEQMVIGGDGTVRGYGAQVASGDVGYTASAELQTPMATLLPDKAWSKKLPLRYRGVFFFDCGEVTPYHRSSVDAFYHPLMGIGAGIRAGLGNFVAFSLDYARGLKRVEKNTPMEDQVHVHLTIAY